MNEHLDWQEFCFSYEGKQVQFVFEKSGREWIPKVIQDTSQFYEIECLDFIKQFVVRPGVFLDVGANIGNHSIYFSKIIGRDVLAFEAVADNYMFLCENINRNRDGAGRVSTYNFALGDANYFADFEKPNASDSGSYRRKKGISSTGSVEVRKLDDVLLKEPLDDIAFMKIDVEGMELEVLRGASNILKKNKPVLCLEIKSTKEYAQIYDFLTPLGYCVVGAFNATPTFVFDVIDSAEDIERLKQLVRNFAVYYIKAKGRK